MSNVEKTDWRISNIHNEYEINNGNKMTIFYLIGFRFFQVIVNYQSMNTFLCLSANSEHLDEKKKLFICTEKREINHWMLVKKGITNAPRWESYKNET